MLILEACGHDDEALEIAGIKTQAELYGIKVVQQCIKKKEHLTAALSQNGSFEYIYLSSHGDDYGFENETGSVSVEWTDFGSLVCETECLERNGILMLSCCRGGLNQIAYDMFWLCPQIEYVVGPRQSLNSVDMLIAFQLLMYNVENRRLDPIVACDRVLKGTDVRFTCFDRMETMSDTAYLIRTKQLERLFT
ncbi:MAG: hypothetical protein AAF554_14395 [Bacteroidota bacterium]